MCYALQLPSALFFKSFVICLVVCVVLADPHKRAIYDTTGIKGLETDGWEVLNLMMFPLSGKLG